MDLIENDNLDRLGNVDTMNKAFKIVYELRKYKTKNEKKT